MSKEQRQYRISGAEKVRHTDFGNELKKINFKKELVRFLLEEWSKEEMAPFIDSKIIFVNYEYCYKYRCV